MNALQDYFENWTVQVRKGVLELCILNALERGECYGYDLVKLLMDVPGLDLREGTVYPLLSRLRLNGLVSTRLEESPEGPARKYYTLTDAGRTMLALMNTHLNNLITGSRALRGVGGSNE